MSWVAVESPYWTRRRWWLILALVFCGQLGFIVWLGDRSPVRPRGAVRAPVIRLAGKPASTLLRLEDSTLFALPHIEGFAGDAWLRNPPVAFRFFDWSERPLWLPLPIQRLGEVFRHFVETNAFDPLQSLAGPAPQLTLPASPPAAFANRSALRIEGNLAGRRLRSKTELPAWPSAELLTNTIVQLMITSTGQPASATLLSSSGSREADQYALAQAKAARFDPLPGEAQASTNPVTSLNWARLVFEWQTVPPLPASPSAGQP